MHGQKNIKKVNDIWTTKDEIMKRTVNGRALECSKFHCFLNIKNTFVGVFPQYVCVCVYLLDEDFYQRNL